MRDSWQKSSSPTLTAHGRMEAALQKVLPFLLTICTREGKEFLSPPRVLHLVLHKPGLGLILLIERA